MNIEKSIYLIYTCGAGMAQRLCNGHLTARGSIQGGWGVKTELHVLRKGQ